MTTAEVLTVTAIVLGPILAVQIQKRLEVMREKRDRKKRIFESLMTTRGTPLSPEHVQALNMIQLAFSTKKTCENDVTKAWRVYLDHLCAPFDVADPQKSAEWVSRKNDLFVELLEKMAGAVGYDFDKVLLRKEVYVPIAYGNIEEVTNKLRTGALDILEGRKPLKVEIAETAKTSAAVSKDNRTQ